VLSIDILQKFFKEFCELQVHTEIFSGWGGGVVGWYEWDGRAGKNLGLQCKIVCSSVPSSVLDKLK